MKRLDDDTVPQTLGEILIKHGTASLTDPKLCENLLKDYCGAFKEEIVLLVLAVKERIASDLLVSQEGLDQALLQNLLIKRLLKGQSISESEAVWAVESWRLAIRALSHADPESTTEIPSPVATNSELVDPPLAFGVIGQCGKSVRAIAVSPLTDTIVSGGDDGAMYLWQLRSETVTELGRHDGPVRALAFSPNGVMVASASGEHEAAIQLTDLQSRETVLLGQGGKQTPNLIFSPGGKSLASASADARCEIQLWNLQNGQMRVLRGAWKGPGSISFSPDGSQIAAADSDLTNSAIRIWDVETGTARVLGHSTRQITSVGFLADGKHLASGSWDETIRLWNIQTGEARILGENCACVCRIAISADRLAAYSLDGKLRVWDLQTRRSKTIGECFGVNAICFMADDRALVSGGDDGTIRLWGL